MVGVGLHGFGGWIDRQAVRLGCVYGDLERIVTARRRRQQENGLAGNEHGTKLAAGFQRETDLLGGLLREVHKYVFHHLRAGE